MALTTHILIDFGMRVQNSEISLSMPHTRRTRGSRCARLGRSKRQLAVNAPHDLPTFTDRIFEQDEMFRDMGRFEKHRRTDNIFWIMQTKMEKKNPGSSDRY